MEQKVEQKKMSLFSAVLFNINIMLGAGIFLSPGKMAAETFSVSFLGWPLVAIIFLPVVWSMAVITEYFEGHNSFFNYAEKGMGRSVGFISGWLYFLGYASIPAVLLIELKDLLVKQFNLTFIDNYTFLFNLLIIGLLCAFNMLSVNIVGKLQNTAVLFKLTPLFFGIFLILFYFNPNFAINPADLSNLKFTIPMALFAFWGFESSCNITHLIENSKKNAFRAVMLSFFAVTIIYTLFHLSVLFIMGSENLAKFGASSFVSFLNLKSALLEKLINVFILATICSAYLSSTLGIIFANSTNLYSLAKNRLLPFSDKILALNKNNRPANSIIIMGLMSLIILVLTPNTNSLLALIGFGLLGTFVLTFISLLLIQLKRKEYLNIIVTLLAFVSCFIIAVYSWQKMAPTNSERFLSLIPFVILIIIGFGLFKFNEYKTKKVVG